MGCSNFVLMLNATNFMQDTNTHQVIQAEDTCPDKRTLAVTNDLPMKQVALSPAIAIFIAIVYECMPRQESILL